ncbi:hypothetical protein YC2023_036295 [Brassica napus]
MKEEDIVMDQDQEYRDSVRWMVQCLRNVILLCTPYPTAHIAGSDYLFQKLLSLNSFTFKLAKLFIQDQKLDVSKMLSINICSANIFGWWSHFAVVSWIIMLIHGLWALLVRSIWQERYKCSWFVVFLNYDNIFRNVIGTGEEVGTLWDQYAVDEFYKDDMSWLEDDALIGSDKLQYYGVYSNPSKLLTACRFGFSKSPRHTCPFLKLPSKHGAFAVEAEAPQETLVTK